MRLTLAILVLCASPSWAQGGMGGGGGGGGGSESSGPTGKKKGEKKVDPPITWAQDYETGLTQARQEDKFSLVFILDPGAKDPSFITSEATRAAGQFGWVFIKKEFDADDPEMKRLKITATPCIVGLDRYGNDFNYRGSCSQGTLDNIVKKMVPTVLDFKKQLATDWADAQKIDAKSESKLVKALLALTTTGKRGFPEIAEALNRLRQIGDKRIKAADALAKDPDAYLKSLREIVVDFKDSCVAASAELRMAVMEREKGITDKCVDRVLKVLKCDPEMFRNEVDYATTMLRELVEEGNSRVDQAVAAGDAAKLKQLAADYSGTPVEKKANDALKAMAK